MLWNVFRDRLAPVITYTVAAIHIHSLIHIEAKNEFRSLHHRFPKSWFSLIHAKTQLGSFQSKMGQVAFLKLSVLGAWKFWSSTDTRHKGSKSNVIIVLKLNHTSADTALGFASMFKDFCHGNSMYLIWKYSFA